MGNQKGVTWHLKWLIASYGLFIASFLVIGVFSLFAFDINLFELTHQWYFMFIALGATGLFGFLIYKKLK
jgi:hypothetical protein